MIVLEEKKDRLAQKPDDHTDLSMTISIRRQKEIVTVFRVHAIVQLVMIAATPIPTTRGQLCLAIDKIFLLTLTTDG